MQTKWLEDLISLSETRSFTHSAILRHVTQPALTRRIQALEAWAGTGLVDRSFQPPRLTPAGETLRSQAQEILQSLQSMRATLRGHNSPGRGVIEFAMPHSLALSFFPAWLKGLQRTLGVTKARVTALNMHDAVFRLVEGHCDFLLAYHHDSYDPPLPVDCYDMISLGQEILAPFSKGSGDGRPLFTLPGSSGELLPYLAYAPNAYLAKIVDGMLDRSGANVHLRRIYETDMAESLKAMALQGHGIAFLPLNAINKELQLKQLLSAGDGLTTTLDVRIYRKQPTNSDKVKLTALTLWDELSHRSR